MFVSGSVTLTGHMLSSSTQPLQAQGMGDRAAAVSCHQATPTGLTICTSCTIRHDTKPDFSKHQQGPPAVFRAHTMEHRTTAVNRFSTASKRCEHPLKA
jgi:hypothetical protein